MNEFKRLRKLAGLTQVAAAEKIGVSSQAVQKWEYGTSKPKPNIWGRLAEAYKISEEDILKITSGEKVIFKAKGENIAQSHGKLKIGKISSGKNGCCTPDLAPVIVLLDQVNNRKSAILHCVAEIMSIIETQKEK